MNKKFNQYNFYRHTFCIFYEVENNTIENLKINYKSKSGSSYYYTDDGVYRKSNHWGRAANCRWKLEANSNLKNKNSRVGYAKWSDFYPNNEQDNLFYIDVDFETQTVDFKHKETPLMTGNLFVEMPQKLQNESNYAKKFY